MRTWIPFDEILEERMKIPGYAKRLEAACQELDAQIAAEQRLPLRNMQRSRRMELA